MSTGCRNYQDLDFLKVGRMGVIGHSEDTYVRTKVNGLIDNLVDFSN